MCIKLVIEISPGCYCMYSTTSLNNKKFYILPTEYFVSFVRVPGKISKFFLYNPQRSAFTTMQASVYCAVRPGPLNKMDYVLSLMDQYCQYHETNLQAKLKSTMETSIITNVPHRYLLHNKITLCIHQCENICKKN